MSEKGQKDSTTSPVYYCGCQIGLVVFLSTNSLYYGGGLAFYRLFLFSVLFVGSLDVRLVIVRKKVSTPTALIILADPSSKIVRVQYAFNIKLSAGTSIWKHSCTETVFTRMSTLYVLYLTI